MNKLGLKIGLKFGLLLGIVNGVMIYLSNVTFASNASDNGALTAAWLLVMMAVFTFPGSEVSKQTKDNNQPYIAGAVTAAMAFLITMAIFFIVDNIYLNTVSQQADKIYAFNASGAVDMRSVINQGLLRGLLLGLPLAALVGSICGKFGAYVFAKRVKS